MLTPVLYRPTNSAGTPDCQSVVSPVLGSTVKSSEGRLCHLHPLYGFLAHSLTHKDRPYPTYLPPGRDSQHEVCHHLPLHSCAGSTKTVQHSENEKARPQAGVGVSAESWTFSSHVNKDTELKPLNKETLVPARSLEQAGIEKHKRVKLATQVWVTASQPALLQACGDKPHLALLLGSPNKTEMKELNRTMWQMLGARQAQARRVTANRHTTRPTGSKTSHSQRNASTPQSATH